MLKATDLELSISELTLGSLTTNALQLRDYVGEVVKRYDAENYSDDNIDQAKADKALLNKAAKELNDKRIKLEREWAQPFQEFKGIITETCQMLTQASSKIDKVVGEVEWKAKEAKRTMIHELWERKGVTLFPLSKIWDERWLNKTKRLPAVEKEIGEKLLKVEADLDSFNALDEEDREVARAYYLDCFDLQRSLAYARVMRENKEKLKAEEQARRQAEAEEQATRAAYVAPTAEQTTTTATEDEAPDEVIPEILERTMVVRGTREQLIALADFMKSEGIWFKKA